MNAAAARFLSPSEAARQLGISAKALRLYEERGLIAPGRTPAGWRAYGPAEMARGAEIVELRALGLSVGEVARILNGDAVILGRVLAAHEATLEARIRQCGDSITKLRRLRADLGGGKMPATGDIIGAVRTRPAIGVAFDLPWPWGGERFELRDIKRLNYIVGPLGSGKTRLAQRLAEALPGAGFVGLDRAADGGAAVRARLDADPAHNARVAASLATLLADGAADSPALTALLAAFEAGDDAILVIDMLEQGLDAASQEAVIAHLRRRGPEARPLFFLTRSNAILDLDAVGDDEAIILCPANHSRPICVTPVPGAAGYEAVATCLASPEVRARTEGTIAWRPS
ncbi:MULTISPECIES: MerR family transcriptional regulator [Bradyrhizobium]|jgi:DNA-binding transcriptional MerR regulator|uniref:MerR family transcriptional regulator n=1 Tax=Bradyrhizobium TaxID=374 RepID=UPI000485F7EE|nr:MULTISPECIES: MerR family transcriptional regulator [Bradyrhizobium]MCS3447049.1 DNA-binding transcriptional MerR regulator [Bradyrhizobium elkanii]MCS3561818.1 DNA-binding transcriptional MerR regulator [Bradyrhizobium elkanii]MCW2148345.1 DNA-binding transcriptional MerR regulator [Bradyrhizobium elkanii]MCW2352569.1 DNA-binding transcriptional MerR regulator [Bradyrhizobium elkanii]MCW2372070.1 DNA-binding transcriptional MerR regulator [Bradyrhizobium elkanii]